MNNDIEFTAKGENDAGLQKRAMAYQKVLAHQASMFAFTATPKPTTIQLFGRLNTKGQREAFHVYSMKQAIEEGFILDVLQNYTDILMKSDKLKTSAKNNTQKDFEFSYFDDIDDALIEGLSQNQDFFSLLLSNEEMKRQVLGIFSDEIYKSLRNA